ncbi:FAD-dependent pyridine nucleotide-disulfide oxidoreductase [Penicillium alfredii]|uniref:FAD-dependent pyridine nucleotide-disulfide oxidoreductase n=1 Tax=Penicillium alfredii TaxID=1506179 RepID=A0A9W9G8X6_9EURO|nr:FAD-dependent pyridine nucleotide-disulfide oxidoreductase [Penicillium alfredii]KAJ5114263.1 FAD-dependent pyridine nucleotide-disulfide oxidoreductase [Penicillium alfredii]
MEITVVDERDGYFHLIGSPKALACETFAATAWTRFQDIPALESSGLKFIQGSVSSVDFGAKVAHILDTQSQSSRSKPYDYLIASSGLRRVFPTVPQSLRRNEFLEEANRHMKEVQTAQEGVVVVGGGAVGVEMAAELKLLDPTQKVTLIHSRKRLLSSEPLPDDFAERVDSVLHEGGVEVILGQRVVNTTAVDMKDEQRRHSRCIPTSTYLAREALNEDGYVKVHSSLQFSGGVLNPEHHYAVGDIAAWSGIKRCGGAMHMGHFAATNIHQHMLATCGAGKPSFVTLQPFPSIMGLALGKKTVSYSPIDGTRDGEDIMASMFGGDMGNTVCWNYMRLGEACPA